MPNTTDEYVQFPVGSSETRCRYIEKDSYHLLELNIPPDNRLTIESCGAIVEALAYIKTERDPKPLITTSAIAKFFSNGLDFERAMNTPNFFPDQLYTTFRAFLEFPWPTVALVNGHAFAAGFTVALCHDFVIMNPDKGFLCMNEVEFGAPMPAPMMAIPRVKLGYKLTRDITLTAHRYTGKEAFSKGIVDQLGGIKEAEELVNRVGKLANAPSYAAIRKELLREALVFTLNYEDELTRIEKASAREEASDNVIVKRYKSRL